MPEKVEYICNPQFFPQPAGILNSRQLLIEECLELPCGKPDMEQLVDVKVQAEIDYYKVIHSPRGKKIYIRGRLEQEIMYSANAPCQPVHVFNKCHLFKTFLDLSSCCISDITTLEMHSPRVIVEYVEAMMMHHRCISKSILLFIWYPVIIPPCPQPVHVINSPRLCTVSCKPCRPCRLQPNRPMGKYQE